MEHTRRINVMVSSVKSALLPLINDLEIHGFTSDCISHYTSDIRAKFYVHNKFQYLHRYIRERVI